MPTQEKYTQRLGLANLDVYLDTTDNSYFNITGLPNILGYGKHGFRISYNDPIDGLLLKQDTGILFEFVDSNGETVFSELSDIPDFSGAASAYVWIKKDPLWIAQEIANGPLNLYVVGELEGVPPEFENRYNVRSTFTYEVRKSLPNTSPIIFYDIPSIEASASISGDSVEFDVGSNTFSRGYINVSSSFLQTHGGQVSFIELSYKESGSRTDQYTVLTQYPLIGSSSRFEIQDSGSVDGLNPISHEFKMAVPRDFRRDTDVFFKLRFLDANKTPAKHYSETRNNQEIEITSSAVTVNGTPFIIEKEDNLLKGSMYTGNAVGKGFEQSGKSSAYLKTVDYTGFISASTHIGSPGVMFFSGSVLTESGDNYEGVGLELVGDSESFFRFRSDPSILDIRAQSFFVGSEKTQFISASGGIIEISSSKFHLSTSGDVKIIGDIDADGGTIGGFEIQEDQINSTNQDIIFKANGQISASSLLLASGSFVIDPNNLSRFGQDGFGSFVMADNTGVKIQTSDFNLNTARFIISSSDVGVMAMGSTPPLNWDNGKGIYMSGDGEFLAGDSQGERMQFNGFNLVLSSSAFFLGNQDSFMSGSEGKILISGSDIGIQTPRFFFGDASKFISGSLGNLEISSSRFHLDVDGNVKLIGRIEAESGFLGGFGITQDAITGSGFFISGGAENNEFFISSSNFNVKASGDITGSQVLFQGGKIAAFNLSKDALSTDSFFISASATGQDLFISASSFNVNAQGIVTASALSLEGGDVGGLAVAEGTISVGEILKLKDSGQVTGSDVLFSGGTIGGFDLASTQINSTNDRLILKSSGQITASDAQLIGKVTATSGQIAGWTISGDTLVGNNATLDGAGAALFRSDAGPDTDNSAAFDILRDEYYIDFSPADQGNTKNYYVKFGPNFAVDVNGILHASGAQFEGTISASKGIIGGFTTDNDSFSSTNIFISGSPAIGGTDHPRFMFISSSNFNVKESGDITGSSALFDGNIDVTGTGTIGGFVLDSSEIRSSNNNLRLKSSGNITGSQVLFTGGTIGGFDLSSTQINSTNDNLILKSSGQITASDAQIQGKITAQSGTIGGFNIGTDLDSSAGTLKLKGATGQITASDAQITGKITAESGTIGGFNIGADLDSTSGTLKLKGASGQITASDAQISGNISATTGQIAGFTISGNTLVATNFTLDASGKRITLGTGNDIFIADGDEGIQLGNATFGLAPFSVTKGGVLKAVAGTIGGFGVSSTAISSSNDNIILKNNGQITGSNVLFNGGVIGGFTIDADEIKSTNLLLDSANEKITVGSANAITIQGGGTDNFIVMGSKTAFAQTSTAGVILGMDNNVPSFDLTRNATNYVRFDTSTGVDIKTDTFKLDTSTLDIDSSTSRIQVIDGSSNEVVRFGEISDSASDLFGLKVYDGSGTADSNTLVKLGGEGNTIGGWTITNDQIVSNNLIIHSSGRLETSDFASGVKGWRISSEGNGEAEFENVRIRGTLSTAVFEKETVNAVGGQLYVANSTALTGSGQISASFATMSVVNVSGFVQGEILSLKKVSDTGFTTEYVFVNSSSRDDPSSDTNFAGKLMVTRGYGKGTTGDSGSLGGTPANSQSYEPGQVIVSTGKVGTGYIRLNANPNDQATPFMDIVERTGTGIYDVGLKVRVGDLSGLSSATLFGNSNPGFGIFTENGFFKGGINATTGSFTGVVHINTSASEIMKLGTNVSGTNDGIFVNNNNFLFTDGQFKTGNATNFISHDGSGDVQIASQNFELKGGSKLLLNTDSLAFDTSNASTATRTSGTGVFMSSSGDFRVGNASGNRLTFTGTSLELVTSDLNIDTSTFDLSTDSNGKIALGATPPTAHNSGIGVFMDGAGNFLAGNASGNHIKFDASSGNVNVAGQITITAGSDISAGLPGGIVSGSAQLAEQISGSSAAAVAGSVASASAAQSTANTANTAASNAQSTANTANTNATNAQNTANTANTNASTAISNAATAQSAIDTMETQVVLSSAGMDLRNNSNINVATFGTTTKFFDGVGHADANRKLQLNASGLIAFGDDTNTFAHVKSTGIQLVEDSTEVANFAATTTIGNTSTEHVEITSTTLKLKDGSTTRLSMDSSGMQIGAVSSGITLNSSGDATFNGTIVIGASLAASISGSAANAIAGAVSSASAAQSTADTANTAASNAQSTANSANTAATNAQNTANTANTAATNAQNTANTANTAAGNASTLASNLAAGAEASASAAQTNATTIASNLAAGSVASASAAEANATTVASNLAAGSVASASAAGVGAVASASALAAGSVASASAAQAAAELLASNLAAGSRDSASAASSAASDAQNAIDTMETQVVLSNEGMSLRNNSSINVATFGTTTKFFDGVGHADSNRKLQLNADGIFAFGDDTNTFTKVFSKGIQIVKDSTDVGFFSDVVRVGALNQQHVSMSAAGVTFMNSATQIGKISGHGALLGNTSAAHISASTTDVSIIQDANHKAVVDASGLTVTEGGNQVAQFAATSVIGSSTDKVTISDSGITIRENNSDTITLSSGAVTVGSSTDKVTISDSGGIVIRENNADTITMASGVVTIGSSTDQVEINGTSGITIRENDVDTITLSGGSVVVGEVGSGKSNVQITSGAINLRNNTTNKMVLGADGSITIGNQFSVDSSGNATFSGTLTVGSLPSGTVSGSAQLADQISGSSAAAVAGAVGSASAAQGTADAAQGTANSANATATTLTNSSASMAAAVQITPVGMNILNSSGNKLAEYGSDVFVGLQNAEHVKISTSGLELKDNNTVLGKFASTTTIGDTSTEHVEITDTSLKLKDDTTDLVSISGTTVTIGSDSNNRVEITPTSMQIGSTGGGITMDSSGNATFNGTIVIGASLAASISGSSATAVAGAVGSASAADTAATNAQNAADAAQGTANSANATATTLTNSSASMAASVQLTPTGMNILNGSGATLAEYGATVTIGQDANDKSRMVLGADSLDLIVDSGGTDTNFASFGAISRIGDVANEHISMSSTGVTVKDGGTQLANFASTTTVGSTSTEHVEITSTSFKLKDGSTERLVMNSSGIAMGSNFSVDASGNVTMAGAVTANTGTIGGFNIGTDLDASSGTLKLKGANGQITASAAKLTGGDIGGFLLESDQLVSKVNPGHPTAEKNAIMVDSGQGANFEFDGNDASGIVFGGKKSGRSFGLSQAAKETGSFFVVSDIGGVNEAINFRMGVKDTFLQISTENAEPNGILQISSSNFSIDSSGNTTMRGTIEAEGGSIGGFTINGNELTGSSGAILSTAATGQRVKISGTDNSIKFFEPGNNELMDLGIISTLDFGSGNRTDFYGLSLAGSAVSSKINSVAKISINNADAKPAGAVTTNSYGSAFTNIFSKINLGTGTDILRGRPAIYGEFESELTSNSATTGLASGVTGMVKEHNNGYWDMSAGVVGVSSLESANMDSSEGGGVPDGQYGVVSVGNSYVKGVLTTTGNIVVGGTVDGRDVATDGSKLDGIEAGANVTDAANVQSAGALMDSECEDVNALKDIDQDLTTGASPEFSDLTISDDLFVNDFARIDALRVGTTSTDPGDGNLYVENDLTVAGKIFQGTSDTVFFEAQATGGTTVPDSTYTKVEYNNEAVDLGGDYSNVYDRFTAPVNGVYFFRAQFLWDNASNWDAGDNPIIALSVNDSDGSDGRFMIRTGNFTEFFSMQTTAILKLDQGDTVHVDAYQNTGTTLYIYDGGGEGAYNQFMGTLLHALT